MAAVRPIALFTAALFGAALFGAEPTANQSLGIILDVQSDYSEPLLHSMRSELTRILDVPGVDIQFRYYHETIDEGFGRVIVVRMIGDCIAAPAYSSLPLGESLGCTHVSEGVILPFVDVRCDRIRALLTRAQPSILTTANVRLAGRALGRVLAHEVYHVLSGSLSHAQHGVAMAALSAEDLTFDELDLSDTCLSVVRRALALPTSNIAD